MIAEIFKRALQLFVLGLLVYFAWIIYRDSRESPLVESEEPQLIMNHYEIFRYNTGGLLEYILTGDTLLQFDNGQDGQLSHPFLTHYHPDLILKEGVTERSIDWTSRSNSATFTQDKTLLTLIDDVVINKPNLQNPQNDIIVTTELLYIHDEGERVTTDRFVEINTPNRKLNGYGLEGFPHKEQFSILKDVKSTFLTNQGSADE